MAIFKPTIFQDISGSVGNVTSYKVGKTQIARGKPGFVKDAQTPEQLKQRARLSLITKLRRRFLKVLVPLGVDGLEAYYPVFTARQTAMLNEMAQEFGILRTGGTDYHGEEVRPGIKLGIGTGDLCVPDDLLPPMLEKLGQSK